MPRANVHVCVRERHIWDWRCDESGDRPGKKKTTTMAICQSEMGKCRTIESVWVCETVLRNVCRNKPIVTKAE